MAQNRTARISRRLAPTLSLREQVLLGHLNPLLGGLEAVGWPKRRVTNAVIGHYRRAGGAVQPAELAELVKDPTPLLLEHMRLSGKANVPSSQQKCVLDRLVRAGNDRHKIIHILSTTYVMDLLSTLAFKQLVEEIRSHDFAHPSVEYCSSGECCHQGRKLKWPEHS